MSTRCEIAQSAGSFLALPGELRNRILRYVVTQPEPVALRYRDAPFSIDVNILYTCKQLRDEARSFLYDENVFEIEVDGQGLTASLHFSRRHSICEYRSPEAITEVSDLFLKTFRNFRFRLLDARWPDSLRRTIKYIEPCLANKRLTVILPPGRRPRNDRRYPVIGNPLASFSILRCASFEVVSSDGSRNDPQFSQLIELVTSDREPIDMAQQYYDIQRSMRAVDKMLLPSDNLLRDFNDLRNELSDHVRQICDSVNRSDQDAFLLIRARFEDLYCQIRDLENSTS